MRKLTFLVVASFSCLGATCRDTLSRFARLLEDLNLENPYSGFGAARDLLRDMHELYNRYPITNAQVNYVNEHTQYGIDMVDSKMLESERMLPGLQQITKNTGSAVEFARLRDRYEAHVSAWNGLRMDLSSVGNLLKRKVEMIIEKEKRVRAMQLEFPRAPGLIPKEEPQEEVVEFPFMRLTSQIRLAPSAEAVADPMTMSNIVQAVQIMVPLSSHIVTDQFGQTFAVHGFEQWLMVVSKPTQYPDKFSFNVMCPVVHGELMNFHSATVYYKPYNLENRRWDPIVFVGINTVQELIGLIYRMHSMQVHNNPNPNQSTIIYGGLYSGGLMIGLSERGVWKLTGTTHEEGAIRYIEFTKA